MKLNYLVAALSATVLLAACGDQKEPATLNLSCDSEAARLGIQQAVEQEILDGLANNQATAGLYDLNKVKENLASTRFELNNITSEASTDANITTCKAQIGYSFAASVMQLAKANYEAMGRTDYEQYLNTTMQDTGFSQSGGTLNKDISYSLTKTDAAPEVKVNGVAELSSMLSSSLLFASVNNDALHKPKTESDDPLLDLLKEKTDMDTGAADAPEGSSTEASNDSVDLNNAIRQNANARDNLDALWKALPNEVKETLNTEQKTWTQSKERACQSAAQQGSTAEAQEQNRLNCETNQVLKRINYLDQYTLPKNM
ncbi:hypothetical protein AB8Q18_11530 [Neisseriaceae bacterium CLB008]|nr:DUF1311 domain-containing protein [Neisseriaceae bacterium]